MELTRILHLELSYRVGEICAYKPYALVRNLKRTEDYRSMAMC